MTSPALRRIILAHVALDPGILLDSLMQAVAEETGSANGEEDEGIEYAFGSLVIDGFLYVYGDTRVYIYGSRMPARHRLRYLLSGRTSRDPLEQLAWLDGTDSA